MPPVISEAKPAMACGRTPQEVMQSHSFLRLRSLPDILPGKGPQPYRLNVLSVYHYPLTVWKACGFVKEMVRILIQFNTCVSVRWPFQFGSL